MKLFTKSDERKLLANGADPDKDHSPVVKFFVGSAITWLISEINPEYPDQMFGLCDLGQGFPELGYVSRREIESIKVRGLGVERDMYFDNEGKPMSEFVTISKREGRIVV